MSQCQHGPACSDDCVMKATQMYTITCASSNHVLVMTMIVSRRHIPRLYDFLWVAEDGMKMQGYNGSQLWDTTFAVQAICATGMAAEVTDCLRKAQHYVDVTQASN